MIYDTFDDGCSILKRCHLGNFFHHISNLHQSISFTLEEGCNGKLVLFDILLKRDNGKISKLVYRKPTHDQYLRCNSQDQARFEEFFFLPCLLVYKDDLNKENARIKPVLKENGFQNY